MTKNDWTGLAVFLVVTFAVSGVAGALTTPEIGGWYAGLKKPSFNPPNWIFGPVWTALYVMIAVAGWLAWRGGGLRPVIFWGVQLALNFFWSILFFAWHRPDWALLDIAGLLVAIVVCIAVFRKLPDRKKGTIAAWLMVPYLLWVGFATVLNFSIWRLNAPFG